MAGINELQQVLDTAQQTKETITSMVDGLSDTAKGVKGAIMKTAHEAVKKAKVKMQLEIEYTKELIPLMGREIEYQALVTAQETALNVANQSLKTAQDEVNKYRAEFETIQKLVAKKNRKAQHGGEPVSDEEKNRFEKTKVFMNKAQEVLDKAKNGLKVAQESLNESKSNLTAIKKQIAKIRVAMSGEIPQISSTIPSIPSLETNLSTPQSQNAPAPEPSLTEDEIKEAKQMGEERQASMEEQISSLDPVLEKMDAEWMIIENGMNVLQNLSAPLAQTSALPAFMGTGAPNTAFNFAVSGCIGLLGMFVLSEMNAAVVRWSALAKENQIQPEPDKLAKIAAISAFKASIPPCCAGGAGYVSPVIAQM